VKTDLRICLASLDDCLRHALRLFDVQLAFALRHGLRDAGMKPAQAGEEFAAFFEVEAVLRRS